MNDLKNEISKTYGIEKVNIELLNQNSLKISFTDSRFNNYSTDKKQKLAKQIGKLIEESRDKMPGIRTGELIFIDETNFIVGKSTKAESFKIF